MNEQQLAAVEGRERCSSRQGAGTGKTSVLVERVRPGGVRRRPRRRVGCSSSPTRARRRRRRSAAGSARRCSPRRARTTSRSPRELDGAWISTIHGFCSRLLRAHPFAVGIDPRFHELDEQHGAVMRGARRFRRAAHRGLLCGTRRGSSRSALRLLTTYGSVRLRVMLTGRLRDALRSARPAVARARARRACPTSTARLAELRATRRSASRTTSACHAASARRSPVPRRSRLPADPRLPVRR